MLGYRHCRNGTKKDEVVEDFVTGANASVGILYKSHGVGIA